MLGNGSHQERTEGGDEVKYFKPDLLAECRSSDPDIADAAAARWMKNAEAYRKHLEKICDRLPGNVRSFLRSVPLHDASLLSVNLARRQDRTRYFLSFQLADSDEHAGVQLCYDRVKLVEAKDHDPSAARDTTIFALYDEFDVLPDGTLTHSILLTGGIEIRIKFSRLIVTHFTRVVATGRMQMDIKEDLAELAVS
jgi:hypothetical protein